MTKEEIQRKIDHYNAVARAHAEMHSLLKMQFYRGKAEAYVDIYNEMFPEMEGERAYPFDEKLSEETRKFIKSISKNHEQNN